MIQEIPISQLDPRQIKQLEAAEAAVQTDLNYSLEIFSSILKQSQGCLELRKKNYEIFRSKSARINKRS